MKKILFMFVALALVGCGANQVNVSTPCAQDAAVVSPVVGALAAALSCTNTAQITSDLEVFLGTLHLCQLPAASTPTHGVIGVTLCPVLVAWGTSQFINNSVRLQSWGCKLSTVQTAFQVACGFVPF